MAVSSAETDETGNRVTHQHQGFRIKTIVINSRREIDDSAASRGDVSM